MVTTNSPLATTATTVSTNRDTQPTSSTQIKPAGQTKMVDVIIIGAGLSGLSAAKELRANNLEVLVLEARDRVGGRTLTKVVPETRDSKQANLWIDLGASYVGPTQDSVLNLCDEFNLQTYLVDDSRNIGYLKSNEHNSIEARNSFSPLEDVKFGNFFHWLDYVHMVKLIDSHGRQIPSDEPWLAPKAREWDSITFKQFVDSNSWTTRVRDYFNRVYVVIDVCSDANEVSMLWFLWYVKQCGGYGRSISTTNGGQERKILHGTQQLSAKLRDSIGPERVLLNKPVCCIDQTSGPFVQVETLDGQKFRGNHVICAIPPHLLLKIHHKPALPAGKNLLAQRCPMGQVAKVILYYERPFWKEHNFSGCFVFDAQNRSSNPIILSLDETKPDGSFPAVIGFAAGSGWYGIREKSEEEIGRIVAECYYELTKLEEFRRYIRVEKFDWCEEQYSGGCYTSVMSINTMTKFGKHLREPFGRIHYAGTETAIKWSGYMDGAVSAGKRAAREILHLSGRLRSKEEVWVEEPTNRLVLPKDFEYPSSHKYVPNLNCLAKSMRLIGLIGLVSLIGYSHLRFCSLSRVFR